NSGLVLRPHIIALATRRGGVVGGKKDAQQIAVGQLCGVELETRHFDMASLFSTHWFVAGVVDMPAAIARLHADDAAQILQDGLDAPKTTAAQHGNLGRTWGSLLAHMCSLAWRQAGWPPAMTSFQPWQAPGKGSIGPAAVLL